MIELYCEPWSSRFDHFDDFLPYQNAINTLAMVRWPKVKKNLSFFWSGGVKTFFAQNDSDWHKKQK